jgi:adenosylhomocysteinase
MAAVDVDSGRKKLDWARAHMPIHARLRERFGASRPFADTVVAVCSHVEAKTGVFIETLAAAGAEVVFTGSEPMSSQDDVIAALTEQDGITGHMRHGVSDDELAQLHETVLDANPNFILDDAAELTARWVARHPDAAAGLLGTCEQTTTGVQRLQAMAGQGVLHFPSYAVNDTPMKHYFDNVHGTGESTLTNLCQATNLLLAGQRVVVAGFGYCGRGLAEKARGWNARVIVTEIDPRRALEAHMAGFDVMPMEEAAQWGDFFITATGNRDVMRDVHFRNMRDGAVLSNAGHFNVEINADDLANLAKERREVRAGIEEFTLEDGRRINLLCEGRLANLAAPTAMGHPAEVMDQTFGTQFMAAVDLMSRRQELDAGVHAVPDAVDREVAEIKLETLGVGFDELTETQQRFAQAWRIEDIKA